MAVLALQFVVQTVQFVSFVFSANLFAVNSKQFADVSIQLILLFGCMVAGIPDICLFSPQAQFLVQLFSTQKRVNRNKTDFATNKC